MPDWKRWRWNSVTRIHGGKNWKISATEALHVHYRRATSSRRDEEWC
jgi:hypothetical protein